jgi:hypothetical protein
MLGDPPLSLGWLWSAPPARTCRAWGARRLNRPCETIPTPGCRDLVADRAGGDLTLVYGVEELGSVFDACAARRGAECASRGLALPWQVRVEKLDMLG